MIRAASACFAAVVLAACSPALSALDTRSPFTHTHSPRVSACAAGDSASAKAEWSKLRKTFPYHLQGLAASPAFESGCRALIVAEPPPGTTVAALQRIAPDALATSAIERHGIGYDGWTADIVFTIPPMPARAFTELAAELHEQLFGSAYRMQVIDTGARPKVSSAETGRLDLEIRPGELHRWLLADGERSAFQPLLGGPAESLRDRLGAGDPGVFVDPALGLVAWIVPRGADIAEMRTIVRRFAVASDLIVGAVAGDGAVAILARQRVADPLVVQPLRFETVSLLAAVKQGSLGQSYERGHFLAGKLEDGRDRAPIFLSPELIDSEYGSVLNIADQILKSWSNSGDTTYVNFNYDSPTRWPFRSPVFMELKTGELTYNWNTAHTSAAIELGAEEVLWLRSTGALNVSYLPGDGPRSGFVEAAEDQARRYFASSQDPYLARVVQYQSLYQIFQRYDIQSSLDVRSASSDAGRTAMRRAAKAVLFGLRDLGAAAVEQKLSAILPTVSNDDRNRALLAGALLKVVDASDLDILATALVSPQLSVLLSDDLRMVAAVIWSIPQVGVALAPRFHVDYAAAVTPRHDAWVHTPAIVLSVNRGSAKGATGGHNLDTGGPVLRYTSRLSTPAADARARGRDIVAVGTAELDRVFLGSRGIEISKDAAPRTARTALGLGSEVKLPKVARAKPPSSDGAQRAVLVERTPDGYRLTDRRTGAIHEMSTLLEASELIAAARAGDRKLVVETKGFLPDERRIFVQGLERREVAHLAGVIEGPLALTARPFDPRQAKLVELKTQRYADGAGAVGAILQLSSAKRAPLMRIQIAIVDASPEVLRHMATKVSDSVQRVFGLGAEVGSIEELSLAMRKELKLQFPKGVQVELKLRIEAADVEIGDLETEVKDDGAYRHGG